MTTVGPAMYGALSRAIPVKNVVTDTNGKFDFGTLKPGHYRLYVVDEKASLSDWFDVEIKDTPNSTELETIDISRVHPDCSGGHEFVVHLANKN